MRFPAALLALTCAGLVTLACEPKPADEPKAATKTDKPGAVAEEPDPDADRPADDDKQATFATPTAKPPPAPEGSVALPEPWLYVQTCAEPHPCPSLKQPAGDAHCRALMLGNHDIWRLPSKDEVARFKGVEGLEATAGYHWTRTPYEEDLGQVWIIDPEDPTQPTTIPRDRKEFRIRCVKEP